ncbi:hypothetical protein BKA67DRAFT_93833 [Truncatella angustata]|uniref:Zn(2)-C6 fungal-type domain-containing protein n=1 Tax=Truncatella angustata TaxID=152316 RepID=A0A9P8RMG1_9PEZI|nr:uncharacterized protein BKA67DRAFT_93833 [Truncatella angustata]KAH6646095.1 hypothetical protein BKA67DRAFT_93833 [Truncatella angustata]
MPDLGHSSTYGQACMQCYKAKCRCVPSLRNGECERCLRLKKQCQPSNTFRRRNAQRPEESDSRIAQLESKIETLTSAMQSIASSSGSSIDIVQLLNDENISASTSRSAGIPTNSTSTSSSIIEEPMQTTPLHPNSSLQLLSDPLSNQAEECLVFFRSQMLPCFPFINFSQEITARQLHHERPFLYQAILAVTTFSSRMKLSQVEDLKRFLHESALINVQSNMDLLLGLLTYLTWSTDAFLGRANFLSRLMMLAISLVYDLRLFKPTPPDVQLMMSMTQGQPYAADLNIGEETALGFMEKQRALLACFVLSSNISSHLGRQDALRWTPQMEEATRLLEMNKSCSTDEAFAFQVRLYLLKQRAAYIREQHEVDRARIEAASVTTSLPGLLYLKTLRAQLHELKSSFPLHIPQKGILDTNAQYIELYINHLAYSISLDSPPLNISGQRSDGGLLPGFERLECLWRSVECIKSWLDNFYTIPPSKLIGLPFHFWSQMILCVTVLKYLSTLGDPAWDCQAVRNTVDLISTIDSMIQRLDLCSEEPRLQCSDSLFDLLSRLLRRCRGWAETWWNLAPQAQDIGAEAFHIDDPSVVSHTSHTMDLDQMGWMQSMNLENDEWLKNILSRPVSFC